MKSFILTILAVFCFGLFGCSSGNSNTPVVLSNPSNSTIDPGVKVDTSMFEGADIAYVQECVQSRDIETLQEYYEELVFLGNSDFAAYVQSQIGTIKDSESFTVSSRSAFSTGTVDSSYYFNGVRVTASAWKQFVTQFRFYSRHKYASEYGDLMEFLVEGKDLYFVYGFNASDSAWDLSKYAETIAAMMSSVTVVDGTIPEYGKGTIPPTCGRIVGVDTSKNEESNGVMFLLDSEHHTNWGKGYCYESSGYTGFGDGVHRDCFMPMHVVFYPDGLHIRQACYVSYSIMLPECTYCTVCFKERVLGLKYLPYDQGDWTYETEYESRSATCNHHFISGVFKEIK